VTFRRRVNLSFIVDRAHYDDVVTGALASARVSVWIGTANLKELHVEALPGTRARARGEYVSILQTFETLADRGVELRILHGGLPSRPFRAELARRRALAKRLALRRCPRVHLKMIAVDGRALYLGSANFTGAGLGAKGDGRRNFEMGILTDDEAMLDAAQERFERIWSGRECGSCKLRAVCPRPLDTPAPPSTRR
jgi:phosphatidylserine/phosphatidylglycerophosphate/cardiolipin synthase-like enzyme